jgi:hypothetical protein
MQTEHTLREPIGLGCVAEALLLGLRAMAWSRGKDLADGAGSLNVPWAGYIAFADCASGTSDEQTSIRRSLRLPARSSDGGMSTGFVRRS